MTTSVAVQLDKGIAALATGPLKAAVKRALRKAGSTALRDMRAAAVKAIRARKRIKPRYIARALTLARAKGGDVASMEWALNVSGEPVPLIAYPHSHVGARKLGARKQGPRARGGVSVEVNVGKRTLVRGAFVATMRSGHEGIFRRVGAARLPIHELLGSRPVDALLGRVGDAENVGRRGATSFGDTFARLLPLEIARGK